MSLFTRIRRPSTGASVPVPLVLLASLVMLGMLLSTGHAATSFGIDHDDCHLCQSLHQVVVTTAPATPVVAGVIAVLQTASQVSATRPAPLAFQGRAPPFRLFA